MSVEAFIGLAAAGIAVGVLSGLMGVGGGVLMVPLLVVVVGESQHLAEGTSLLVIVPTAIVGVIAHRRRGYVRMTEGLLLGAGGILGAWIGARVALVIDPEVLQKGFAVFLLWVGLRLSYRALKARRAKSGDQANAS